MKRLVAAALALLGLAGAVPNYLAQLLQQYHLGQNTHVLEARCQYCHVYPEGGDPWNPFGNEVREVLFGAGKHDIACTLYLVLKQEKDADSDGYPDVLEVLAGSLPGDPKDAPSVSPDSLRKRLEALGGIEYFAPQDHPCAP